MWQYCTLISHLQQGLQVPSTSFQILYLVVIRPGVCPWVSSWVSSWVAPGPGVPGVVAGVVLWVWRGVSGVDASVVSKALQAAIAACVLGAAVRVVTDLLPVANTSIQRSINKHINFIMITHYKQIQLAYILHESRVPRPVQLALYTVTYLIFSLYH